MTAPSAEDLIIPLLRATETGTAAWSRQPNGPYQLAVGDNTVTVLGKSPNALAPQGYTIQVFNKDKEIVDWAGAYTRSDSNYEMLRKLYEAIDRRTRNVGGVIEDILHHLESAQPSNH